MEGWAGGEGDNLKQKLITYGLQRHVKPVFEESYTFEIVGG